jgi:hypothetical protein
MHCKKVTLLLALVGCYATMATAATTMNFNGYQCSKITTMSPMFKTPGKGEKCNAGAIPSDYSKSQVYATCDDDMYYCASDNTCTAYAKVGATCSSDSECRLGDGFDGKCLNKKCSPARQNGEMCSADNDCANVDSGVKCTSSVCTPPTGACTNAAGCGGNQYCDAGKCKDRLAAGAACTGTDNYCVSGAYCFDKKCTVAFSLADGTDVSSFGDQGAYMCKSAYANSDNKCAASPATRTGATAASGESCNSDADCKSKDDACVCAGDGKAVCTNTGYPAMNMKVMALSYSNFECHSTSGCSPDSNSDDPESCISKKCTIDVKNHFNMCAFSKAKYYAYYDGEPTNDEVNTAVGGPACGAYSVTFTVPAVLSALVAMLYFVR